MSLKKRALAAFASIALSVVVPTSFGATSAEAATCDPGSAWISTTGSMSYALTHVKGYQLPPGGSITLSKSASWTKTLTSTSSVSAGASASVSGVIASAEVTVGVNLAEADEETETGSVSVTASVAASSKDRYYAAWAGRAYYTGKWSRHCTTGGGAAVILTGSGTWHSFRVVELEGIALCPASRYGSSSLPYKACKATWG